MSYESISPSDAPAIENIQLSKLSSYINAGGRGTRLGSIFQPHPLRGVSKALLAFGKPPITLLEHQINKLRFTGIQKIVAGIGDHENVATYISENYGNAIAAIGYERQLGNGGDLVRAVRDEPDCFADNILVTNVDTILEINEVGFFAWHNTKRAALTIALTRNRNVPNQDAFYVNETGRVVYSEEAAKNPIDQIHASCAASYRGSSTGALIVSKEMLVDFPWEPREGPLSLYRDVVGSAVEHETIYAYDNGDRLFTDVGTPASWRNLEDNYGTIAPYICYGR